MSDEECDRRCPIPREYIFNTGKACPTLLAFAMGPGYCKKLFAYKAGPNAYADWTTLEYIAFQVEYFIASLILIILSVVVFVVALTYALRRYKRYQINRRKKQH